MVRTFLGEVLALEEWEKLPNLIQAESTLKLSPGFVQYFGKDECVDKQIRFLVQSMMQLLLILD